MLLLLCSSVFAQTNYNTIATAYVTTTISQNVVFNSTMKAGGTFTFSALAHNGGGRAGEADTANVKIQFYTAGGALISTVNSNYNSNLPIPTAQNPPRADPAVPWTTLTVSSTNCGGSCANVAYATVTMYGIDASYWAGDYGPWYRAPTFQQNGGGNLLYNPEFGPAYGYNAQGWTTNPGMGACQGAWGGSNPCIVNSSGVPGSSTTGLVANENGGGPSASGGTTSGTAGGYNNAMSVTNAGPGTGQGPTVTGTTTTYSTRTSTSGNTTYNYRTPTTVNTYSDGTTTSSTGSESLYTTAVTGTQTSSKIFSNRTLTYNVPVVTTTVASTGVSTTAPVTPATLPSGYLGSPVSYNSSGGWEYKTYTYTATTTGTGYLMFAFRNDPNYWVMDNVSIKANNTGANLLVNGGLEKSGLMTANVGGTNQTVAAPTAWGLAYQTNQSPTLGGGYDSGMWYDTSTGSFGAIYQNVNFTAGVTYTITFMVASDYNVNGDTVQMGVYAGSCTGSSTACTLPASTGMTTAITPSQTYTVGCTNDCPTPPPAGPNWQAIKTTSSPVVISTIYPTSYNSPNGEGAANAFDGNPSTKYLNFDKKNAGVTVKLNQGRVVKKFTLTTANDFTGRDPTSYKLYGSNDGVNWTLIKADTLTLSDSRFWTSPEIETGNTTAYIYYFILFPTTKAGEGCGQNCNSMQIGDITYYYDLDDGITSTDTGSGGTPANPGQAGSVCADCAPTAVSTSTTNSVSTSSSSSNTSSVSVNRPTTTGNYTDGFVGTTTVTTTTTTPVTTTTWSDGSTTTSNGTPTSTTDTTYTITPTYGTAPTYSRTAPNASGNSVYIKQVYAGSNPQVSVTQEGNNNAVTGTDSGWATVDGNGSIVSMKQYGQGNIVGLKMNAWGNNIDIKQQAANGGDVNNNIIMFESAGNGNASTIQQQSNSNTVSVKMTYDINAVNVTQRNGTNNQSYSVINGNWNTVSNTQDGSSNLMLVNIAGDNNTATVNQTGTGHSTLLNLIGNKNTVSVIQTGTGDAYSLQQTCTNPSGCSVSVIRNK